MLRREDDPAPCLPLHLESLLTLAGKDGDYSAPTGGQAICLEYIESPRPVRLSFERGRVMPLYAGAASKILLAFLDDRERKRTLAAAEGAVWKTGV